MAMREEFKDPWGWLLAAFIGGLTWAVVGAGVLGVLAGVGVGAAVFATKIAVGGAVNRQGSPLELESRSDALPKPPADTQAAAYLRRARRARAQMHDLAERPGDAWLRTQVGQMDDGADDVITALEDLGGRVTLADQLIEKGNGPALTADRKAMQRRLDRTTDPALAEEQRRAVAALDQQLAGLERLTGLRDQLLTRMATAVVGLESVATRMGEIVTLGASAYQHDMAGAAIADAGADLDALRTGLVEAQRLARQVGPEF